MIFHINIHFFFLLLTLYYIYFQYHAELSKCVNKIQWKKCPTNIIKRTKNSLSFIDIAYNLIEFRT